ncbi:LOW QUALITY PROTEIN: cysteine-rich tail protein 1, partial [Carlito syrichta]|uniref:LOW QUALITY PROTEIN: cysteine-rich tail protein 1 n=1 Tax=Carlito syrichta TaxID=1868482 RepID=A0A3Q0DNT9_CARSF
LTSALASSDALESPAHALDVSGLSHPRLAVTLEAQASAAAHLRIRAGVAVASWDLRNPIFEPCPTAPPLPRREKAAAGGSTQALGPGAQRTQRTDAAAATAGDWAMDPHEMVVKNPYAHISIPRAQLRPDLGQHLETAPSCSSASEMQPPPGAPGPLQPTCLPQPSEEWAVGLRQDRDMQAAPVTGISHFLLGWGRLPIGQAVHSPGPVEAWTLAVGPGFLEEVASSRKGPGRKRGAPVVLGPPPHSAGAELGVLGRVARALPRLEEARTQGRE